MRYEITNTSLTHRDVEVGGFRLRWRLRFWFGFCPHSRSGFLCSFRLCLRFNSEAVSDTDAASITDYIFDSVSESTSDTDSTSSISFISVAVPDTISVSDTISKTEPDFIASPFLAMFPIPCPVQLPCQFRIWFRARFNFQISF